MRKNKLKFILLWIGMLLPISWCGATDVSSFDGYSSITVKVGNVQGIPKSGSIQAGINGHVLSVVFLENLGQVVIEVTTTNGLEVELSAINTPNGVNFYIPTTGNYIVTFTLPNGDTYYGEFQVTD